MEYIQLLLENNSLPVVVAFLLGLLTAISPCPLATNITAIGFISKDIENKNRIFWNGMLYTLGRVIVYTVLGIILIIILRKGATVFHIQKAIAHYGEMFLA
ncbi:MAG: sulfite exporter TauE/SafE family protein, partial [Bacteroidales bacterium]